MNDLLESLGPFRFDAGREGHVEISNQGTSGYVVIDAIQWPEAGQ